MSAENTTMQSPALFESQPIHRVYDEKTEFWRFSVIDIVQVLTPQSDYQKTGRKLVNAENLLPPGRRQLK